MIVSWRTMGELKDEYNFNSLDPDKWEELCFALIHAKGHPVKTVNGRGGDEGIDAFIGTYENPSVVFQFKFFRDGWGSKQAKQIEKSFKDALEKRSAFQWVLMCSADPTPAAVKAFEALCAKHPDVEIKYVAGSEVKALLIETPEVRKRYFPDTQDQLEAISLLDGNRPIEMIQNGVRRLNNLVLDDRLSVRVIADGDDLTTIYEVRPNVTVEVPILKLESKSQKGRDALEALYHDGTPFTLSSSDVVLKPLINFPDDPGECESVACHSISGQPPTPLLLFSGDAEERPLSLYINLKTVRCGAEVGVRSNEGQDGCPIIMKFEYPIDLDSAAVRPAIQVDIRPHYEGCTVKSALKGARFLAELSATKRLGMCDPNGDADDATYYTFADLDVQEAWEDQATFFEALYRVCQFFEINPIVDESYITSVFADSLRRFVQKLDLLGKELKGSLSFMLVKVDDGQLTESVNQGASSFVVDESIWIDLFGDRYTAAVRTVSQGVATCTKVDEGIICEIRGTHTVFMSPSTGGD